MSFERCVCACGAVSPSTDRPDRLDAWEDDHVQWECPHALPTRWDDVFEVWRYPSLPAMTREPADPPPTQNDTTRDRIAPATHHRTTKWRPPQ